MRSHQRRLRQGLQHERLSVVMALEDGEDWEEGEGGRGVLHGEDCAPVVPLLDALVPLVVDQQMEALKILDTVFLTSRR